MPKGENLKGVGGPGRLAHLERANGVNAHLEDSFYNAVDSDREIQHEKTWHRVAIFMATNGKTYAEIARALNRSEMQVSCVLRQPWAQERMQREIATAGRDNLQELLNVYGPATMLEVIDLGRSAKSEQVKLAAKREVLDRWLGKPNQPMSVNEKPVDALSPEELKSEVNRIINDFGNDPTTPTTRPTDSTPVSE